ncbi:LysR family transcriptional regulator [Herbiconiux sp. CPCC 205716]|uniref:LysR family transcriptional regulator n=1 Tax=Herbiconiux gentiana TaxID=2970912 RepID=A0ABT2GG29_9MICO|nr:LysR family transcriptional regulator [Herbiconiux gentiana]MCS5714240.1 LysR family transcriptional regulator [Herbiconiux gentiana]
MLDVRKLVLLRELAIRGTIAAVAEALSFSPSAVSQQLSALEREAGVPLFRRTGRRLQLTPQAEVLVASAAELLDTLERADVALQSSLETVSGTLRVAVFQSAALTLMPPALRSMTDEHPNVRIEMAQREPGQALHDTWAREFDLVVGEEYPAHSAPWLSGLERHDLTSDAVELALPGESASPHPLATMQDARTMPWVMEPRGTASRHFAEQLCRVAGFEPDVRYETADLQTQIRLIETGNAVAFMPELVWAGRPTTCRLVTPPGAPRRTIFTAHRASASGSSAIGALRAALEASAAAWRSSTAR